MIRKARCAATRAMLSLLLASPSAVIAADMRGSLSSGAGSEMALAGEAGDIINAAAAQTRAMPLVMQAVPSGGTALTTSEGDPAKRLLARTPDEVEPYFDLMIYVSKAEAGPIAQHMYVYQRDPASGRLSLVYDWPVSTGREKRERTPSGRKTYTHTPEGIFKLDYNRFHKVWRSRAWNADMPWTMFLDYTEDGGPTGLAVHAAGRGKIAQLGTRASGGCIRLHPDNAETLFKLIQKNYGGLVPVFALVGDSSNVIGTPARLPDGSLALTYGYKVLLHIEDYPGVEGSGPDVAASGSGTAAH